MPQESSSPRTPPLKRSSTPPMLRQLASCVSEESCAVKCAFDFDYDNDEFYVIDEDGDDEDGIGNDGAYWKMPGHPAPYEYPDHEEQHEQREEEAEDYDLNHYDHETLTTRFSRQTSATLESILGASTSSILSPSSNFIIEDLHLLEQRNNNRRNTDNASSSVKRRLALLAGGQNSPTGSQLVQPNAANRKDPLPLHQNLKSNHSTYATPNPTADPNGITPKQRGGTSNNTIKIQRASGWSSLSPKFFPPSSNTPSPRLLPPSSLLPPIIEHCDDSKSKNTHLSCSTDTAMESLTSSEVQYDEFDAYASHIRALELTLSGSVVEMDDDDDDEKSEIIRLDSIIPIDHSPFSCPSFCFYFHGEEVVMERTKSKRKRMWKKFCSKVAGWKRIVLFHLFPHRQRYTRFEI